MSEARAVKITSRMRWIVGKLKDRSDSHIRESRDAYHEVSTYWLCIGEGEPSVSQVTEAMVEKLELAGLITAAANAPIYRRGEFVTSETIYCLPENVGLWEARDETA